MQTRIVCSVVTKNSNWENLTKNLVTFKRSDGVNDERLQYFGGSWKNSSFRGGGGVDTPMQTM